MLRKWQIVWALVVGFGIGMFWLYVINPVHAQENANNFTTSVITRYDINDKAVARVTQEFVVTNKTPTMYLSQYALKLGTDAITSVAATVNGTEVDPHVVQSDSQTSIALTFNQPTIGENQAQKFTISYTDPAVANQVGKVVEINIPKVNQDENFSSHQIVVSYPTAFGQPSRLEPPPTTQRNVGQRTEYVYSTIPDQAIVASFGDHQLFLVTIEYPLRNPNTQSVTIPVALIPDTPYQQVWYRQLEPPPTQVTQDADGNWIAEYRVPGNATLPVTAAVLVKTLLHPDSNIPAPPALPAHTKPQQYWEAADTSIQNVANSLSGIDAVAKYTIDTLSYTKDKLDTQRPRLGAAAALQTPANAVCQEYTDLFIALARAKQIRAISVIGYAYTPNPQIKPIGLAGDVLHTWPEAFDDEIQTWRRLDPTWQDTSGGLDYTTNFDLNHIVFARNGVSSEEPSPAGSYDPTQPIKQHVQVAIADSMPEVSPTLSVSVQPYTLFAIPIPGLAVVTITNTTGRGWYPQDITLGNGTESTSLIKVAAPLPQVVQELLARSSKTRSQVSHSITNLLPFSSTTIVTVLTTSASLPQFQTATVTIALPDENPLTITSSENILFLPQTWTEITFSQTILAMGGCIILVTSLTGSLLVWRHRRQHSVRGQSQESAPPSPELHPPQAAQ